jgi:uncharacterized protein
MKRLRCLLLAPLLTGLGACAAFNDHFGGNFAGPPAELMAKVGPTALALIKQASADIPPEGPADHHLHLAGTGQGLQEACPEIAASGIVLNDDYSSWLHPVLKIKRGILLSASGVSDESRGDAQYVDRIEDLVRHSPIPGRYLLYALDYRYDGPVGEAVANPRKTDLYVPSQTAVDVARCLNERLGVERFFAVGSVHPYKKDAIAELRALADQGVKYIKWLPPSQNIDPSNPMLIPFYEAMRERGMVLLSHTGNEHTFRVYGDDQELGDPIRLALPAELGVTVVMLHSGREGKEQRPWPGDGRRLTHFERFFEMMKRYPRNVFGEIAAVPYVGTHDRLRTLLADPDVRCRLVDGTDYPNPAISIANPTARLLAGRFLHWDGDVGDAPARDRRRALDEIYSYNPELFDFVMKRTIRVDGEPLPPATFYDLKTKIADPGLGCPPARTS